MGWMFLIFIVIGAVLGFLFAIYEGAFGDIGECILGIFAGSFIGVLVALLVLLGIGLVMSCFAEDTNSEEMSKVTGGMSMPGLF